MKAFQELKESEERYRTLFNSIDEGFCVIEMIFDADGKPADFTFLETNPAFEKQSGLGGVAGKRVREILPQLESHWFETYGRVALTGESIRFIDEARALDGRWFDVYAFRLGAPENRRVAVLFTDISERRRLQEQTREQAESLASLNLRKDEFLAMLSHELRNPLAAIQYAAHEMRLRSSKDPMQAEALETLDRQVAQLTRLVDDLLDVSRITTGRIRLKLESLDLRGVVHRAVEISRPQAEQKRQRLTESSPMEALWVQGDAARLEQVLVNLLDNAIKYTDREGQIAVTLRKEGDEAVLHVSDSGVGIAPEVLPHIFELFTQADQSLDRAQGGLGIGLALVQLLIAMHKGRIEAHSALGRGSEFIIRLPVSSVPDKSSVNRNKTVQPPTDALRVLVVEDNPDVARSIERLLRVAGHTIRVVHNGASAMKVAVEFAPDAVLLDIGLPDVDGLQLAKWIRQEPALQNLLLIALTGYGLESDTERIREAGIDHHLVKPVRFEKIARILATAIGKQR
jgi:PAS domain S-box-containing protein